MIMLALKKGNKKKWKLMSGHYLVYHDPIVEDFYNNSKSLLGFFIRF